MDEANAVAAAMEDAAGALPLWNRARSKKASCCCCVVCVELATRGLPSNLAFLKAECAEAGALAAAAAIEAGGTSDCLDSSTATSAAAAVSD